MMFYQVTIFILALHNCSLLAGHVWEIRVICLLPLIMHSQMGQMHTSCRQHSFNKQGTSKRLWDALCKFDTQHIVLPLMMNVIHQWFANLNINRLCKTSTASWNNVNFNTKIFNCVLYGFGHKDLGTVKQKTRIIADSLTQIVPWTLVLIVLRKHPSRLT